ncbi:GNAT family N-acetyltransferase [Stigmatella sp. ncwal1]|uniref:GNAT family N-acetyltransferase n=1 Tax=Stigmatella ashevillensis TaxID=2995309 RepID=A0ABT5DG87_9BACT|nr:GNAT family N-acetyltransferase [Stigmatella ashevillena]MDC0712145.1 GNAT family N-acetyltransferase [Stigmatella ashevillena]
MTDAELAARLRANLLCFKRLQASGAPDWNLHLPGVWASVRPNTAQVLFLQQVLFWDVEALGASLGTLEGFFRGHGIPAWRVQVPSGELRAEDLLRQAGYRREEIFLAMGVAFADVPSDPPGSPLESLPSLEELIQLSAGVFGSDVSAQPWHRLPPPSLHAIALRKEGRVLACGLSLDEGDTAGIYLVATAPEARRQGLASEVMRGLLTGARERGLTAAVLQSTAMGHGVYQRLGFRTVGRWTNWVRRLEVSPPPG